MKWSWRLATVAGVTIYVHATFLILVSWLVLRQWAGTHSVYAVAAELAFVFSLFVCYVLHDCGHALTATHFGITTHDITLFPSGGVSRMEGMPENSCQELWIALAGPVVSFAIAGLLFFFVRFASLPTPLSQVTQISAWDNVSLFATQLMFANLVLAVFNLLPAFPMDGGRMFRAVLAKWIEYSRATQIPAVVGQGLALSLGLIGLFTNPFLLFVALFVWIGAAQESGSGCSTFSGAQVHGVYH